MVRKATFRTESPVTLNRSNPAETAQGKPISLMGRTASARASRTSEVPALVKRSDEAIA